MKIACIPAYNEELTIGNIVSETLKYVDKVIVCNDGSRDRTALLAKEAGAIVVSHISNRGKGAALKSAFHEALKYKPEVVIMLDSDGQHCPDDIPAILKPILDGVADVVVGSRYLENSITNAPLYRRLGLSILNALFRLGSVADICDTQSGFRAFNREAFLELSDLKESGYNIETEQLFKLNRSGFRIVEIPINVNYDVHTPSKKNPVLHGFEVTKYVLNLIIHQKSLNIINKSSILKYIIGLITVMYFIYILNRTYFSNTSIVIISIVFTFMGFMMFLKFTILNNIYKI